MKPWELHGGTVPEHYSSSNRLRRSAVALTGGCSPDQGMQDWHHLCKLPHQVAMGAQMMLHLTTSDLLTIIVGEALGLFIRGMIFAFS